MPHDPDGKAPARLRDVGNLGEFPPKELTRAEVLEDGDWLCLQHRRVPEGVAHILALGKLGARQGMARAPDQRLGHAARAHNCERKGHEQEQRPEHIGALHEWNVQDSATRSWSQARRRT